MVRTQIQLEERQYEEIRRRAHRARISMSEAIRRMIDEALQGSSAAQEGAGALLKVAGIASSGIRDLGRQHDRYLAEDEE